MQLTNEQVAQFERDGYLFFEELFSPEEVAALDAAIPKINADLTRGGVRREASSDTVRFFHGPHLYNDTVGRLSRHPRLAGPAAQLLDSSIYVFQSRLVMKTGLTERPFSGFPWHQDFSTWYLIDGMVEPTPVIVAIFVDEVTACNAPIQLIPQSHRYGLITDRDREPEDESYSQIVIHPQRLRELVDEGGITALLGAPGSVLFMHSNLVHASTENISPLRRAFYYVIYDNIDNVCQNTTRSQYRASLDNTPITALPDDCLIR